MKTLLVRRESTCGIVYDRDKRYPRTCSLAEADAAAQLSDAEVIDYSATPAAGKARFGAPLYLFLDITSACPCRCWYCYNHSGEARPGELTADEIRKLIGRFAELGGVELRLAGGEPTLHPNLIEFLEQGYSLGLRTVLVTNGLIAPSVLERLACTPVKAFYISIQGDEPTNDVIRGRGSYRKCVESAEFLARRGARVRLSMVFHKQNQHCVAAVTELAARIGANVAFNPLRPLGRGNAAMMLDPEEHRRLVFEVVALRRRYPNLHIDTPWDYLASPPGPPEDQAYKRLGCGGSAVSVTSVGDCYACGQLSADPRFRFGNIRDDDLAVIWRRLRGSCPLVAAPLPKVCGSCAYLHGSECFGGCAATALVVRGALDALDPYCFVQLVGAGAP